MVAVTEQEQFFLMMRTPLFLRNLKILMAHMEPHPNGSLVQASGGKVIWNDQRWRKH